MRLPDLRIVRQRKHRELGLEAAAGPDGLPVFKEDFKFSTPAAVDYYVELELVVITLPLPRDPTAKEKSRDFKHVITKEWGYQAHREGVQVQA